MCELALIAAIPLLLSISSFCIPLSWLRVLVPIFAWCELAVVTYATWPVLSQAQDRLRFGSDFAVDQMAALFMLLSCAVAASCLSHAAHYFQAERHELKAGQVRLFYGSATFFLLCMICVFACDNLGILWIAMELTTLSTSALVYFERTKNALEATWKYLIICSVGIAFALLGTILIFASSQQGGVNGGQGCMQITTLIENANRLQYQLARLGAVFCVLGYGTKAGIFPLHNWLPDAHSEAPAPASAMLSGGLLNCALFAIWRVVQIMIAEQTRLIIDMVIIMGAITAVAASLMLIRQKGVKRMWAYSSIENVGIMLVAIGLGSGPLFFLQALNHSVAKVALFLVTGNIVQACGTKVLNNLHGIIASQPVWAVLLVLGSFSITGTPPFGMFVSELGILMAAANPVHWPVAVALLLAVSISFVAISLHVGRIVCGAPRSDFADSNRLSSSLIPGLLVLCSVLLGTVVGPQFWLHLK